MPIILFMCIYKYTGRLRFSEVKEIDFFIVFTSKTLKLFMIVLFLVFVPVHGFLLPLFFYH